MHNDDLPVGRVLSRREALKLLGASSLFALGYGATRATLARDETAIANPNACVVRPELTEGPYFVDEGLNRSDIRFNSANRQAVAGVPLSLHFSVSQLSGGACRALPNAVVDVWHCDALGYYSDVEPDGTGGMDFLRGLQRTDANGIARFTTIYPGWYRGRAVHIHFKIRGQNRAGRAYEFTSQLFFPDALSDEIYTQAPYKRHGASEILNRRDDIFRQGGNQLLLKPMRTPRGLAATLALAVQI